MEKVYKTRDLIQISSRYASCDTKIHDGRVRDWIRRGIVRPVPFSDKGRGRSLMFDLKSLMLVCVMAGAVSSGIKCDLFKSCAWYNQSFTVYDAKDFSRNFPVVAYLVFDVTKYNRSTFFDCPELKKFSAIVVDYSKSRNLIVVSLKPALEIMEREF